MMKAQPKLSSGVVLRDPPRFSDWSTFEAVEWRLAAPMVGQRARHGALLWSVNLGGGESLLDDRFARLRRHLRLLVWTIVHDPRGSKALSPGGLTHLRNAIQGGARWMASENMTDFERLDSLASWRFVEFFLRDHEKGPRTLRGRQPKVTWSSASACLKFVALVHRQRRALERFGVRVPAEPPFDGRNVDQVVQQDLDLHRGTAPEPIPDEIAIRVMNGAQDWLGVRASDIGHLATAVGDLERLRRSGVRVGELEIYRRSKELLASFEFSTLDGDATPWMNLRDGYERAQLDGRTSFIQGRQILRRLLLGVQGAAVICIQATTGIRASELTSFEDDGSPGPLPSCIEVRRSVDGLLDLFYAHGVEIKVTNERGAWLIASRLAGTDYLPPSVLAFSVLHTLFAKWREVGGHGKLLLSFSASRGLPKTSLSIGVATSQYITYLQKIFFAECCDQTGLSSEVVERFVDHHALRGQLWRKTFATYLFRIDARLLEPISRHFKHLRVAMTEAKYNHPLHPSSRTRYQFPER